MLPVMAITFREAARKRIVLVAAILTVVFIAMYGTSLHFIAEQLVRDRKYMPQNVLDQVKSQYIVLGLFLSSLIISVTAVFASVGAISSEADSGLLQAVLARSVRRREVILGKFLGYAAMLSIFSIVIFTSIMSLGKTMLGIETRNEIFALGYFVLQPLLLMGLAVMFSTFLSTLGSGIAAFTAYAIATVGGFIEQIGAVIRNPVLIRTGIVSSLLMPSDALYRKTANTMIVMKSSLLDAYQAANPFASINPPSPMMTAYAIGYLIVTILIAIRIFSRRDIS